MDGFARGLAPEKGPAEEVRPRGETKRCESKYIVSGVDFGTAAYLIKREGLGVPTVAWGSDLFSAFRFPIPNTTVSTTYVSKLGNLRQKDPRSKFENLDEQAYF
jgi:hypothetical protein